VRVRGAVPDVVLARVNILEAYTQPSVGRVTRKMARDTIRRWISLVPSKIV
jgi:hypothetical protein